MTKSTITVQNVSGLRTFVPGHGALADRESADVTENPQVDRLIKVGALRAAKTRKKEHHTDD